MAFSQVCGKEKSGMHSFVDLIDPVYQIQSVRSGGEYRTSFAPEVVRVWKCESVRQPLVCWMAPKSERLSLNFVQSEPLLKFDCERA